MGLVSCVQRRRESCPAVFAPSASAKPHTKTSLRTAAAAAAVAAAAVAAVAAAAAAMLRLMSSQLRLMVFDILDFSRIFRF